MEEKREKESGTVVYEDGKYFLKYGGEKLPLDIAESQLKELKDQKVEVLLSEPKQFVVGLVGKGRPPITCYIIFKDMVDMKQMLVNPAVREDLAKQYLNAKIISPQVYAKLTGQKLG